MRRTIYLAGAIESVGVEFAKKWRNEFKELLKDKEFKFLDPLDYSEGDFNKANIVETDKKLIDESDVIIANLEHESAGTAMEVFYANQKEKIIIAFGKESYPLWYDHHATYCLDTKNLGDVILFLTAWGYSDNELCS